MHRLVLGILAKKISSKNCRMFQLRASFGALAEMCLVHWVLVATFCITLTHANGDSVDSELFQLLGLNNAANGANNHPGGVVFPSSPVGPDRPSSSNNRQTSGVGSGSGCNDRRQECKRWAQQGECRYNIDFMAPHCARSCGYCDNPDPKCKNTNDYCMAWTIRGECRTNPDYMRYNCASACKACGSTKLHQSLWRVEGNPPGTNGIAVRPPGTPSK